MYKPALKHLWLPPTSLLRYYLKHSWKTETKVLFSFPVWLALKRLNWTYLSFCCLSDSFSFVIASTCLFSELHVICRSLYCLSVVSYLQMKCNCFWRAFTLIVCQIKILDMICAIIPLKQQARCFWKGGCSVEGFLVTAGCYVLDFLGLFCLNEHA